MSEATGRASGSRPKKKANAFRPAPGIFSAVIAGADEVVANSFIAQGTFEPTLPGPASSASSDIDLPVLPMSPATSAPTQVPPLAAPLTAPSSRLSHASGGDLGASQLTVPSTPYAAGDVATDASKSQGRDPARAQRSKDSTAPAYGLVAPGRADPVLPEEGWAHQALTQSFVDAVVCSNTWTTHGFRIVPDVLNALKARLAADRRTSGNAKLAVGHYLDAALRHAPTDVAHQVSTAQAFLSQRMGIVNPGRQSTYRIGPQARILTSSLNTQLQEADHGRKGIFVVSACIQTLLNALDTEGPLQPPTA